MGKVYVADDGSWGSAEGLRIIDVSDEDLEKMEDMSVQDILDFLLTK